MFGLDEQKTQFFQNKLDRAILDYLIREGFYETAKLFAETKDITFFSDLPVFVQIRKIVKQLESEHNCAAALEWCRTNRTRLAKKGSSLEFLLKLQEFMNLML